MGIETVPLRLGHNKEGERCGRKPPPVQQEAVGYVGDDVDGVVIDHGHGGNRRHKPNPG